MSVEVLGRDMLGEVKEEGFDDVWIYPQSFILNRDHKLTLFSFYAH